VVDSCHGDLLVTKESGFKKVVRRHARETGQRYTEALLDLEGLEARMFHQPVAERLLAHLRERYGIDALAATQVSVHRADVFRIDRRHGGPWIARAFPPARPRAGAEGDAAILQFLARHDYPSERVAVDDAVSDFEGGSVLVTEFIAGEHIPPFTDNMTVMADLLGRLHALPLDDTVSRPGGAQGIDPTREGSPRQDLLAALAMLDAVDVKVPLDGRESFEQLRDKVRSADAGEGLPEALLHGNLPHAPDHVLRTDHGPVVFNWTASGRGPRLADLVWLMRVSWGDPKLIDPAVDAYCRHVDVTDQELDRLEEVMYVRPLYLDAFGYRRTIAAGGTPGTSVRHFSDPDNTRITAEHTRKAIRRHRR
jgi:Ser/Thr protein kinase RdoA (MazF antagonist)